LERDQAQQLNRATSPAQANQASSPRTLLPLSRINGFVVAAGEPSAQATAADSRKTISAPDGELCFLRSELRPVEPLTLLPLIAVARVSTSDPLGSRETDLGSCDRVHCASGAFSEFILWEADSRRSDTEVEWSL